MTEISGNTYLMKLSGCIDTAACFLKYIDDSLVVSIRKGHSLELAMI